MTDLKLVIFDVDGTLVDSQADILAAMRAAFGAIDRPVPAREAVLGIVGLSLPQAIGQLAPDLDAVTHRRLVEAYKDAYAAARKAGGADGSPLFPGMRDLLADLQAQPEVLLGIATGKSRRGLDALLDSLDLRRFFVTAQVADDHPSKPHPSMILAALSETGVDADHAVMIGDTRFDIEMAHAARVPAIGVTWGYHPAAALQDAAHVVTDAGGLRGAIDACLGVAA